ncbi:hypothetical protein DTO271G3_4652 [Paecilomyces variotii]|nr:hypothetical protein DTO271G3_4652 [Paecilomyces variotii]
MSLLLAAAGLATNQPPASLDPVAALGLQPITVGLLFTASPSPALLLAGILGIILGILDAQKGPPAPVPYGNRLTPAFLPQTPSIHPLVLRSSSVQATNYWMDAAAKV